MNAFKEEMKMRTLEVAKACIQFTASLPKDYEYQVIKRQLIRSVTSVGANYHATCRGKSKPDFINKLHIVEEECDECLYWLELIKALGDVQHQQFDAIQKELSEILAIVITSIKTTKGIPKEEGQLPEENS